jgi:AcrR family transcriptional regulator
MYTSGLPYVYAVHMSTPRLSQGRILDVAMEIVDRGGIDGLTVRRLAERLRVTPMAMYRHFDGKQGLIDAIIDRATSEIPLPPSELAPREALAALAREIRATVLRYAPLIPALVTHPSLGPSALRLGERGYAALEEAGVAGEDVWRGWNLIAIYALGFSIVEAPRTSRVGENVAQDPTLTSQLAPRPSAEFTSEAQFEHGLERVLAGIPKR